MVSKININNLNLNNEFRKIVNSELEEWNNYITSHYPYDSKLESIFDFANNLFKEYLQLLNDQSNFI